jgi:hypothetical protein
MWRSQPVVMPGLSLGRRTRRKIGCQDKANQKKLHFKLSSEKCFVKV